jgi:hypothetical protein
MLAIWVFTPLHDFGGLRLTGKALALGTCHLPGAQWEPEVLSRPVMSYLTGLRIAGLNIIGFVTVASIGWLSRVWRIKRERSVSFARAAEAEAEEQPRREFMRLRRRHRLTGLMECASRLASSAVCECCVTKLCAD